MIVLLLVGVACRLPRRQVRSRIRLRASRRRRGRHCRRADSQLAAPSLWRSSARRDHSVSHWVGDWSDGALADCRFGWR